MLISWLFSIKAWDLLRLNFRGLAALNPDEWITSLSSTLILNSHENGLEKDFSMPLKVIGENDMKTIKFVISVTRLSIAFDKWKKKSKTKLVQVVNETFLFS